ncbi:MAG TPA: glycoside hydrolase family 30 beta sandwich domain-containing protein [Verrucomicrobiae bacterium]|nr:glycoside hydrolase family 30 beta sandwich domain-containing protein [Verrucomicrobiae bacterium]
MNQYRDLLVRQATLGTLLLFWGLSAMSQVEVWLTSPHESARFERQPARLAFSNAAPGQNTIEIKEDQQFQTIDGFGFCLTGGSAMHVQHMSPAARTALLEELFSTKGTGIGSSYLRVTIGASDLDDHPYSYDDLPPGQSDPELKQFSLQPDRRDVLPVLKQIVAINPALKILGSPWSPPAWMKTNQDTVGGSLDPRYYSAYANYFVKYIQAMHAEGIPIDAITVQNEPLNPRNNPSLLMLATEQKEFIKHHLGPAFRAAGIQTKILLYDHNADHPEYPLSILADPEARQFVDGSAFHLYRGPIDALGKVHEAYPDKNLYFTEQWVGAPGNLAGDLDWHVNTLIIGASKNWCRTVLEWNLASNPQLTPHTDRGGCDRCLGAVTIDGDKVTRNPAYYIVAHAAKFVRPGSVRVGSNHLDSLSNVAFRSPEGKTVLVVVNTSQAQQQFEIGWRGQRCRSTLPQHAVGTYVW